MNDELKFYLVGLYALKPDLGSVVYTRGADGTIERWDIAPGYILDAFPQFYLEGVGVVAQSEEQARIVGLNKLLKHCPVEDGWILHNAAIHTISRSDLLQIADTATGDHESDGDGLIM